jgi:hypothetical protein
MTNWQGLRRPVTTDDQARRRHVGPEVGPTSAFYSCVPTGMHGLTCIFWANLTPFSLAGVARARAGRGRCGRPGAVGVRAARRRDRRGPRRRRPRVPAHVRGGALNRASPNFMGLASLRLVIGIFCDLLYSVLLLDAILRLEFLGHTLSRPQVRGQRGLCDARVAERLAMGGKVTFMHPCIFH